MKKFLAIFLVLTLLFSFVACNPDDNTDTDVSNSTTENTADEQSTNGEEDTTKKKPR